MRSLVAIAILTALPAMALAECPVVEPAVRAQETEQLFDLLKNANSEPEARALASEIWAIWSTAPDQKAQELLDKGVQRIGWSELDEAETALTYLVDYCPNYAEGWNQRAFARFLKNDLDGALADLDRTLELEPRHFGALAGRGLTLLRQGRQILGQQQIRAALKVHPWLSERALLPPDQKT